MKEKIEEEKVENINSYDENKIHEILLPINNNYDKSQRNSRQTSRETKMELEEKVKLIKKFDEISCVLKEQESEKKNIEKIYEKYLDNVYITKSHIKQKKEEKEGCCFYFVYFIIGPAFGIIYLIGIFQMKPLMKALADLINVSFVDYYNCYIISSDCNTTISTNENSAYNFYDYYYNYSMNETIDFNLVMITGFIGTLILRWRGFKFSILILSVFNFGSILWLLNFDFEFKAEGVFIFKILNLCIIYGLLLIGIGGSSLLSHQILIEAHLKYKQFQKEKNELEERKEEKKTLKDKREKEKEKKKKKQRKKIVDDRYNSKFSFFFMICIITTIGYLGKYSVNLVLKLFLENVYGKDYDKKTYIIYIMILYGISTYLTILLYSIFKYTIFEYDEKGEDSKNKKSIKISQICGYIIYSEKKINERAQNKNCCTLLFCENMQNCCNKTFCELFKKCDRYFSKKCDRYYSKKFDRDNCNPECSCPCCLYKVKDYKIPEEEFCYCYKIQRKSFWCNKFMTNKTQREIFPYMLLYFVLQLTTIGFEKQYENHKNQIAHIKTWFITFISTFILFFYHTLSYKRIFDDFDDEKKINEEDEDENEENEDPITRLSYKILNGTLGILVFNGIFSMVFSFIYLSNISKDIKVFFFEDYLNIIFMPILMNKLYYITLNYYSIYTAEKNNRFQKISASTLISIYISLWGIIISLIKSSIPDKTSSDDYNYSNILYFIQIAFSSIPVLGVVIFIIEGLYLSTGHMTCNNCNCKECKKNFALHKFLFWLLSFIFCFGGLWNIMKDFNEYEYQFCDFGECCDITGNYCNVYCIDNIMFCDCCCCDIRSCWHSVCCDNHCNNCECCLCCSDN